MTEAQACPVHPERLTYITCRRCGRAVCPECMVAAPVGFQCRQCVQGSAASTRSPVTVAGGAPVGRPVITFTLIGLNLALFLGQFLLGVEGTAGDYGMFPLSIALENSWYRLLTSAFLHGSILHIAFNMYVLFALGPTLERILGHLRFAVLYVIAALGGAVASYAFSDPDVVSVGASGAIFGLMGALVVAGQRLRYDIRQVVILLVINVVIGFLVPNVDWRAHLGGLVIGAAMAAVLVWSPRRHRLLWQLLGSVVILLGLLSVTVWRTMELRDMLMPTIGT